MQNLLIAGTHSGAGKTTLTLGIMRALFERGHDVQAFKAGPDYIDPLWHRKATQKASHNLDEFMLGIETTQALFQHYASQQGINIIEGVAGFYDGINTSSLEYSSYNLANFLNASVVLVVDGKSSSTSLAATVKGFQTLAQPNPIQGVIVNRVNHEAHYQWIKKSIEYYCGLPVLGYLPENSQILLPERNLGLIHDTNYEENDYWQALVKHIEATIDLDQLLSLLPKQENTQHKPIAFPKPQFNGLRIAVAKDAAFLLYYQANLDLLKQLGAELCYFSPLQDKQLPPCDAVYIGGGFPELYAQALSDNGELIKALQQAHQQGMPIYAESGGLLYLAQSLSTLDGKAYPMAAILDGHAQMTKGLQNFGYCLADAEQDSLILNQKRPLYGHKFHKSEFLTELNGIVRFGKSRDGEPIKAWRGAYQAKHCFASFFQWHFWQQPSALYPWLEKAQHYSQDNLQQHSHSKGDNNEH